MRFRHVFPGEFEQAAAHHQLRILRQWRLFPRVRCQIEQLFASRRKIYNQLEIPAPNRKNSWPTAALGSERIRTTVNALGQHRLAPRLAASYMPPMASSTKAC